MNALLPDGQTLPGDEGRDPRLAVLEIVAYFMADETFYGTYAPLGIGHAYEVMWWNGTAFEYIEPVHYFASQATVDANGKILIHRQAGRHIKYFTRDELTVVIRYEGKSRQSFICTPIGQPIPGKTDRPACLALGKELVESQGLFGPDTQFYGILFDLEAPGFKGKGGVSVLPRGFENGSIKVIESETGIKLGLTGRAIRQIFEAIKEGEGWPTVFRFW